MDNEILRGIVTGIKEETSGSSKLGFYEGKSNERTENAVPIMRPYGLDSFAPDNTECLFVESEAGMVVLSERHPRPSITQGQVILYDAKGALIKLNHVTSGRMIEIGKGGTVKDAARKDDTVAGNSAFVTWLNAVAAAAGYATPWPAGPPATPVTNIGTITSGSATVGIED